MIQSQAVTPLTNSDGTMENIAAVSDPIFVVPFVATTTPIDARNSNIQKLVLTASLTTLQVDNMLDGQSLKLLLGQDATGSRTITNYKINGSNSNIKWAGGSAPTLTTTALYFDEIILTWDQKAGVARAKVSQNYSA